MSVVFIDTETTGLDAEKHVIWDLAIIEEDGTEHQWFFRPPCLCVEHADPIALDIGKFYGRTEYNEVSWIKGERSWHWSNLPEALEQVRKLTWNKHLVGAVPSFDEERLRLLMETFRIPHKWHYHLIDIEALAVGYLAGRESIDGPFEERPHKTLPWKSRKLYEALGVVNPVEDEHTALGDARLAKAVYERIMK